MAPRPFPLSTDDGVALEGELWEPDRPWARVVLAHPHPQHGGSMRSIVTGALFTALGPAGVLTLRFNFRGVEGSGGSHEGGVGERRDVAAAIDAMAEESSAGPLVLVGWSFGGDVSAAMPDERLDGWVLVAPPLRTQPDAFAIGDDLRPKLLVVPEHDQFLSPEAAAEATAGWRATEMDVVAGADHFVVGRTDKVVESVTAFLRTLAPDAP